MQTGTGHQRKSLVSDSFIRPTFTIEQVRTFLTVASREHITQAARALGLSQPAVTQQVQLLERTLGVQLLERLGRGVRLTDAGEEVAGACLLIMRALENLERTVRSIRGLEAGSLTLGATQVSGSYYLSPALTTFSAAHPSVTVDITTAPCPDICQHVAAGLLECAVVDGPLPRVKLDCTRLAQDEVILVVHPAHPLASLPRISPENLADTSFLTWEHTAASDTVAARLLGIGYQSLPQIGMANIEAVRRALMAEPRFIAALPQIAIAECLDNGTLAWAGRRSMTRSIWAVRRAGAPMSPAGAGFWKVLFGLDLANPALTANPGNPARIEDDFTGA
jgi:DNA-binding transcriptional LysR family regulator